MDRTENSLGPFIGYHGCDKATAESVLSGKTQLKLSENDWDWLGSGIYFWGDSPERGYNWATHSSQQKNSKIKIPSVVGAFIYPGLCLNLTDIATNEILIATYNSIADVFSSVPAPIPTNKSKANGIYMHRALDCMVINSVHENRDLLNLPPFDTVYGVFEEGGELYPGSGFKEKTHVQISVRNPKCIIGYFRTNKT